MTANLMIKLLGFSATIWLFTPAIAQFEVSPDHFDEPSAAEISQPAKPKADILSEIREQQKLLENYDAQIKVESLDVEAALNHRMNGNKAGQAEARCIHQRQFEELDNKPAFPISETQTRLAFGNRNGDVQPSKPTPGQHETNMPSSAILSDRRLRAYGNSRKGLWSGETPPG